MTSAGGVLLTILIPRWPQVLSGTSESSYWLTVHWPHKPFWRTSPHWCTCVQTAAMYINLMYRSSSPPLLCLLKCHAQKLFVCWFIIYCYVCIVWLQSILASLRYICHKLKYNGDKSRFCPFSGYRLWTRMHPGCPFHWIALWEGFISTVSIAPINHTKWECRARYNNARTHTRTHMHTHARTHVSTHTHTHTHTYTYTYTYTHTHTLTHASDGEIGTVAMYVASVSISPFDKTQWCSACIA